MAETQQRNYKYNQLKFPLKPFIELRFGDGVNWFRIPHNYLVDCEIYAMGENSSNMGARFNIQDPEMDKITNYLVKLRSYYIKHKSTPKKTFKLRWGWIDAVGKEFFIDRYWSLILTDLDVSLNARGANYNITTTSVGMEPLVKNQIDSRMKEGVAGKSPLEALFQLLRNHNSLDEWRHRPIRLKMPDGIKRRDETSTKLENFGGDNKSFIACIKEVIKQIRLKDSKYPPEFIIVDDEKIDGQTNIQLIEKVKTNEINFNKYKKLNTLYNGNYYHRYIDKQNIIDFNLKAECWMAIFGVNQEVGATDTKTGEMKKEKSEDKDMGHGKRTKPKMDGSKADNRSTPEANKLGAEDTSKRLNNMMATGDITILGDPNIFDPYEHLSGKYINIFCNNPGNDLFPRGFYTGRYLVVGFKHSFSGGLWKTILTLLETNEIDIKTNLKEQN